jgi:predicted dehydrogenase
MPEPIRWGILGTGYIARQFAEALQCLPDAELAAVASRARETAEAFGDAYAVPRRHASYEALAADPGVDVVYIATPHALHKENSILCLRAGKAVLCEKPFTINAREAEELIAVARAEGHFLMEAMWTRFLPAVRQAQDWLAAGAIGEARMVRAAFGFRDDGPLLFDPALGGGSLLDVGVYPITLAALVFGRRPERITGLAHLGRNGVDEQAAYTLGYPGGGLALLASAIQTNTPYDAWICGTEGMIRLHAPFWAPDTVSLIRPEMDVEERHCPYLGNGYPHQASEVMACLREGRRESTTMSLDTSLDIMCILDALRAQWGLVYPMERRCSPA